LAVAAQDFAEYAERVIGPEISDGFLQNGEPVVAGQFGARRGPGAMSARFGDWVKT
jgi:hypothetical protein